MNCEIRNKRIGSASPSQTPSSSESIPKFPRLQHVDRFDYAILIGFVTIALGAMIPV